MKVEAAGWSGFLEEITEIVDSVRAPGEESSDAIERILRQFVGSAGNVVIEENEVLHLFALLDDQPDIPQQLRPLRHRLRLAVHRLTAIGDGETVKIEAPPPPDRFTVSVSARTRIDGGAEVMATVEVATRLDVMTHVYPGDLGYRKLADAIARDLGSYGGAASCGNITIQLPEGPGFALGRHLEGKYGYSIVRCLRDD